MTNSPQSTLLQTFHKLPLKIKEWLSSEEATYIIIDLDRRLGLEGIFGEVIPHLITRLVTKDIDPKKFIDELSSSADLDWPIAYGTAQEIERRILRPVEVPLRNEAGVDIKEIFLAKPPAPPVNTPATPDRPTAQTINPSISATSPIYRPTPPVPPSQSSSQPMVPPLATREVPVKINVQPNPKPADSQPFGSDSWVNKLK